MARSLVRWTPTRPRPGADRRLLLVVAAYGGFGVQAVLVVAALEQRASTGRPDPTAEAAAPSF